MKIKQIKRNKPLFLGVDQCESHRSGANDQRPVVALLAGHSHCFAHLGPYHLRLLQSMKFGVFMIITSIFSADSSSATDQVTKELSSTRA
jgi:hypothetical protein